MPSAPVICYGIGDIGIVEVFFVVEANHKSHADRHIGICGEVKVDLQHIAKATEKNGGRGECRDSFGRQSVAHGIVKNAVAYGTATVGKDRFFCQADRKTRDASADLFALHDSVFNVEVYVRITDDGACDALMEKRGVQQKQPIFLLCLNLAAANVHDVGNKLEGIEGDADGESYGGHYSVDRQNGKCG